MRTTTNPVTALLAAATLTMAGTALANDCVVPFPQVPAPCDYPSPDADVLMPVFPGADLIMDPTLLGLQIEGINPGGLLGGEIIFVQGFMQLDILGTGDLAGFQRQVQMQIGGELHISPPVNIGPDVQFDTEWVVLQGDLFGDPDFQQLSIQGGAGIGLPAPGQSTFIQLPGGDFNVDSFFDIAYQIDFQGAPGGSLDGLQGGVQAPPVQQIVPCLPPMPTDCNGNSVPDDLDIANGFSFDSNGNGVPDECETQIEIFQLSLSNPDQTIVQPFSDFGEVQVTLPQPPEGEIAWLNVSVDGRWVVGNMPMLPMEREPGADHTYTVRFDLENPLGQQVPLVDLGIDITTGQLQVMPPPLLPDFPVQEQPMSVGTFFDDVPGLIGIPDQPLNFFNPFLPALWDTVTREGVPGVEEDDNGCAPGSAARCLSWLNSQYCLGFPAGCTDPSDLYDSLFMKMGTTTASGTSSAGIINGINQFIADKGLGGSLSSSWNAGDTPNDAFDDLKAGYDVLGLLRYNVGGRSWGHVVTLTGMTRCPNATSIGYRDDADQGDPGGDDGTGNGTYNPVTGAISGFGAGASWFGTVTICPSPLAQLNAIAKELFGTNGNPAPGGGAPIPSLEDLIDRIIDGSATTEDLEEINRRLCKAIDLACQLLANLQNENPQRQAAIDLASELKTKITDLKALFAAFLDNGDPATLGAILQALDEALTITGQADDAVDCNDNGIDDLFDIRAGTSEDLNGNGKPDETECLCDRDGDGIIDVLDLLNYLSEYFIGGPSAELSGDTPASITVIDLLNFLSCWFPASNGNDCP